MAESASELPRPQSPTNGRSTRRSRRANGERSLLMTSGSPWRPPPWNSSGQFGAPLAIEHTCRPDASVGVEIILRTSRGEGLLALLESRDAVVIAPSHFFRRRGQRTSASGGSEEVGPDRARFAVARLTQLVTLATLDDLIMDALGAPGNLTIADAAYVVLAHRTGAALMTTDERMLGVPGLDDISCPAYLTPGALSRLPVAGIMKGRE
jgi:predicted nucleic acid-binding protein